MKLSGRMFEARAEWHLGIALAGLSLVVGPSPCALRLPILEFVDANLGWARASFAVGQLYRRTAAYAAARTGTSRERSKRVPSGS